MIRGRATMATPGCACKHTILATHSHVGCVARPGRMEEPKLQTQRHIDGHCWGWGCGRRPRPRPACPSTSPPTRHTTPHTRACRAGKQAASSRQPAGRRAAPQAGPGPLGSPARCSCARRAVPGAPPPRVTSAAPPPWSGPRPASSQEPAGAGRPGGGCGGGGGDGSRPLRGRGLGERGG